MNRKPGRPRKLSVVPLNAEKLPKAVGRPTNKAIEGTKIVEDLQSVLHALTADFENMVHRAVKAGAYVNLEAVGNVLREAHNVSERAIKYFAN